MGDGDFGSAGFLRVLGAIAAFSIAVGVAGALVLTAQAGRQEPPGVEFAVGRGIGVVVLEPMDGRGEGPFTDPVAVDLAFDPLLLALPPLNTSSLESPHRRHSAADRLAAGEFGHELIRERDERGELTVGRIRGVADRELGLQAVLEGLDDSDGDRIDDDGRFSIVAADGSAVCVTIGTGRAEVPALASGGYSWNPYGPCGGAASAQTGVDFRLGTSPGTYGAVSRGDVCDVGGISAQLATNPQAAAAWAIAYGIEPEEIPTVLESLTPVVLLRDTVVTDHGYFGSRVAARLAILQRGTAVLIDEMGRPVVRCMSGSPLRTAPPLPSGVQVEGEGWRGFSLARVQTVPAAIRPATTFTLVDVETGLPFDRVAGVTGSLSRLAGPLVGAEG